jgi:hypothetical protein
MGTVPWAGSQRARTMTAVKVLTTIMVLKRPTRSATMPGRIRPKILESVSGDFSHVRVVHDGDDLPNRVEDRDEVVRKVHVHALRLSLEYQVREGQEHAEEEEPTCHRDKQERHICERSDELHYN